MTEVHGTEAKWSWPYGATREVRELDVLNGARERVSCCSPSHADLQAICRIHVLVVAAARMRFEEPPPLEASPVTHGPHRRGWLGLTSDSHRRDDQIKQRRNNRDVGSWDHSKCAANRSRRGNSKRVRYASEPAADPMMASLHLCRMRSNRAARRLP
jgi:hypothetical protein